MAPYVVGKALAIYAPALRGAEVDRPIESKDALAAELGDAVARCAEFCESFDIDLDDLVLARGFEFINLRNDAVEALLHDDERREEFQALARQARKLYKATLPHPAAETFRAQVAVVRVLSEALKAVTGADDYDLDDVIDAVDRLLDRSIGTEEYVIRAAADDRAAADRRIDLSQIDFESLATRFAGRKRTETERLAALVKQRAVASARKNPTRHDMVHRIEALIAAYNAGSVNIDEYLRGLIAITTDLSADEQRVVAEDMTEEEETILDLLTNPGPALDGDDLARVRRVAKGLLAHIHDKLVIDWRTRAEAQADMRVAIRTELDSGLPADPYPREVFEEKVQAIFEHVLGAYASATENVYTEPEPTFGADTGAVIARIHHDAEFARIVNQALREDRTLAELLAGDETRGVEYKSTARWNVREGRRDKAMEDAVIKTVAAFLNTEGGTLLIGVTPERTIHGLADDYAQVKPANADGFVNWLDTMLDEALGKSAAARVSIKMVDVEPSLGGGQVCRVDVPPASRPTWAKTSEQERVFYRRRNNSTVAFDDAEQQHLDEYIADRWPAG